MFSKISRYRDVSDTVSLDAKGRVLASKGLRISPEVAGRLEHTIEQGDRLDQLAYKFYKQPRDWWRIADANPGFMSAEALLGNEPETRVEIPLTWEGSLPPWSALLQTLARTLGVHVATMGVAEQTVPQVEILDAPAAFDIDPTLVTELDLSARAQAMTAALAAALLAEGVTLSTDVRLEKPDAVTWRVTDRPTRTIFTFRHFVSAGLLTVHESVPRYSWGVTIRYNTRAVTVASLLGVIEGVGFSAGPAQTVGRVGKSITIPARTS